MAHKPKHMNDTDFAWNQHLGAILKRTRKQKHLTVPQLAGLAGTAPRNITGYEAGVRRPDARMLLLLSALLEIDLNKLALQTLAWRAHKKQDTRQLKLPNVEGA